MKINNFIKKIVSYFDSKQILTEEEELLLEQGRNLHGNYLENLREMKIIK